MASAFEALIGFRRHAINASLTARFGMAGGAMAAVQEQMDPFDQYVAGKRRGRALAKIDPKVNVVGLNETRRALRRVNMAADKAVQSELKQLAGTVARRAKANTPVRTGMLQRSIRKSVTLKRAAVTSALPYAPLVEFGGVIAPRGTPIAFKPARMMGRAVDESRPDIERVVDAIGDAIERAWVS